MFLMHRSIVLRCCFCVVLLMMVFCAFLLVRGDFLMLSSLQWVHSSCSSAVQKLSEKHTTLWEIGLNEMNDGAQQSSISGDCKTPFICVPSSRSCSVVCSTLWQGWMNREHNQCLWMGLHAPCGGEFSSLFILLLLYCFGMNVHARWWRPISLWKWKHREAEREG